MLNRWDYAMGVTYILAIVCVVLMVRERMRISAMPSERPTEPQQPVRWTCRRCGGTGEEPTA